MVIIGIEIDSSKQEQNYETIEYKNYALPSLPIKLHVEQAVKEYKEIECKRIKHMRECIKVGNYITIIRERKQDFLEDCSNNWRGTKQN